MKSLLIAVIGVICLCLVVTMKGGCAAPGVVVVPGYEHAVGFCGEEYHTVVYNKDSHYWMSNGSGHFFIVNKEHLGDPEITVLEGLASAHCTIYNLEE